MSDVNLEDLFPRPSDEDRARRRNDLVQRANLVLSRGWAPYRYTWSTGEVVGVAVLLGDGSVLADLDETVDSGYRRWAYDLLGMVGAQADETAGLPATRAWFKETRAQLYRGPEAS